MNRFIKAFLRTILPKRIFNALVHARRRSLFLDSTNKFRNKTRLETFDDIYKFKLWGAGESPSSGTGSYGRYAEEYISFVHAFIAEHSITSITDIGCGDFNIGSQLATQVHNYRALDISPTIIEKNRRRFKHFSNVSFATYDACLSPPPFGDLITVRQVLQHLSNSEIERVLKNVESAKPRFALITEHLPDLETLEHPNVDIVHGPHTRVTLGSGVVITMSPFFRQAEIVKKIEYCDEMDTKQSLYLFLWHLS